ncbi:MAG: XRE family transcriptional regulator [Candidatus Viridilinea halotolerans]|uniref:XRE family transcriptional regulator n=1 Tax=Candidatus Viridilinea halotolerans TaxID=2491704 RepID=A0A426U5W1_9CHLR|nr:MAG: XRE family transcriptional regulator [Candidatus Viridilinea halotolerans]
MIYSRLKDLIDQKETIEGRSLSYRTIQDECGVSASTISRLANNKMDRFEKDLLNKLCLYFACSVSDILEYRPNEAESCEL